MSRQDWKYLWLLLKDIAAREKKTILEMIVMGSTRAALPFISIVGMGVLLDGIYTGEGKEVLVWRVLVILASVLICRLLEARATESFNQKLDYTKDLESRELNRQALSMDYEYLEDTHVQELRSRAFAKSYFGIRGWFLWLSQDLVKNCVAVLIAFGILFPLLWKDSDTESVPYFFWINVALYLMIGAMIWWNCRIGVRYTRKVNDMYNIMDGDFNKKRYYTNMLAGVESQKDLRINRQQEEIGRDIDGICEKLHQGEIRLSRIYIRRIWMRILVSDMSGFMIYLFTGLRAYMGLISIGDVVIYASGIIQLINAFSSISAGLGYMKQMSMFAADYVEYMNLEKRKYQGSIPVEKRRDNRFQVSFEHVSFRYPGTDKDVIKDLTLSFEIGERMAIVGKNGSGKSTFIKLLCRLYDVTEGGIKVNGIDIRMYDYQEYCNLFAVVFQDFHIFALPLGENIAASENVEEKRALNALEKAGLKERIEDLPNGLDTCVGKEFSEAGIAFSGGEKQKIAIARAIYKDAPFVIMDEPTAALDPVAECDVYAGFDKMVGLKTALYISHRLASCRFCEDILVFDHGRVVQRGSHDQLKRQDGIYRELWEAQAQYYTEM